MPRHVGSEQLLDLSAMLACQQDSTCATPLQSLSVHLPVYMYTACMPASAYMLLIWFSSHTGDLVLDVPDAPELLSLFISRAVVDDVLPPAYDHEPSRLHHYLGLGVRVRLGLVGYIIT